MSESGSVYHHIKIFLQQKVSYDICNLSDTQWTVTTRQPQGFPEAEIDDLFTIFPPLHLA